MARKTLNGAVVVITGASSGIGRAAAQEFAREGARLVLAARDERALHAAVQECEALGAQALAVPTDVTNADAVHALAAEAARFGGHIDVWVNNAGVGAVGAFDQTPIEAHEQVVQTDLLGYIRGAHAVLPYFKEQRAGILINNLSLGSWAPQPYAVAYSAAKVGLRGFTEALHGELGRWPDIHVCDVYPSIIDTPGLRDGADYTGRAIHPPPPVYDPCKVARAMVSLARRPRRTVPVGVVATIVRLVHAVTPGYARLAARAVERALAHAEPVPDSSGNLFQPPSGDRRISYGWRSPRARRQLTVAGAAVAVAAGFYLSKRGGG